MKPLIEEIIEIRNIDDLPSENIFLNLPRNKYLVLKFLNKTDSERKKYGENLKEKFKDFQIGIHTIEPIIGIRKLISDNEIDKFKELFVQYAFDYRELATKLIHGLARKIKVDIQNESPYWAFLKYWQKKGQNGVFEEWNYFFHGFHCHFIHTNTKQEIEVSLVFGLEFGDLDPYFFTNFIISSPDYKPLPIEIYESYHDGLNIIERMIIIGKFEKINSTTFKGHTGTILKDRPNKAEIETFENQQDIVKPPSKFSFLKFLGLKKSS